MELQQTCDHQVTKVKQMIRCIRQSFGLLSPRRKRTLIVALIGSIAVAVAIVLHTHEIEFELLRLRAKSSLVVVIESGRNTAFSLNEKQTRHLLTVVQNRTHGTLKRESVIFRNGVCVVSCMDHRSACLRRIWVHPLFGSKSRDVFDELIGIVAGGVPEASYTNADMCKDEPMMQRVY